MTTRRGGRPSQVRPRPPSTGRPAPAKPRPRPPVTGRGATHRRIERSRGLPLVVKLMLVLAVAGLGVIVLYTATGGLSKAVATLGTSLGGVFDKLTSTSSPAPSQALVADSPTIESPTEPYTNQASIDLVVTVPSDVVGRKGVLVRLYVALKDQTPAQAHEE